MKIFFKPTKEMIFVLAVAFLPLLVFGIIAVDTSVEMAKEAAVKEDTIIVSDLSREVEHYLIRTKETIESLTAFPIINKEILKAIYNNNNFHSSSIFESIVVLDKEGLLKERYPFKKEMIGLDFSRRPFFNSVKEKKRTFFSRLKFSSVSQEPVVGIAAPVFNKQEVKGIIQGSIKLQALSSLVKDFSVKRETGEAFLINQFGEIIAHPNYDLVQEQENIANVYPVLTQKLKKIEEKESTFQYQDLKGKEYLISFQTIPSTNWKLIIRQEMGEVLASSLQLRQFLIFVLVITLIVVGVVSYQINSYITRLRRKREELIEQEQEARKVLEIKVRARTRQLREQAQALREENRKKTKELRERVKELEKFHKLTVGREMKMIELKKKIKKLKEKIKGREQLKNQEIERPRD